MIIKTLADAATRLDDPSPLGYQWVDVSWALTLTPNGDLVSLVPLQVTDSTGASVPLRLPAPNVYRSSGVYPYVACDQGIYSLGLAKPPKSVKDRKAYEPFPDPPDAALDKDKHKKWVDDKDKHEKWVDLVVECARGAGNAEIQALSAWLLAGKPGLVEALPSTPVQRAAVADSRVAFQVLGSSTYVHLTYEVEHFWFDHVSTTKAGRPGYCTACGRSDGALVRSFPTVVPIRCSPGDGTTTGVALTSANVATVSRDLKIDKDKLSNASICLSCALHSVEALIALASTRAHRWSGDDSWTIWWLRSGGTPDFFNWLDRTPTPAEVAAMFDQLRAGVPTPDFGDPEDDYYALTYSARGPRIVIRSWVTGTLRDTAEAIGSFLDDSAVVQPYLPDRPWTPLWAMAKAAGDRRTRGARVEQKSPAGAHAALVRAALTRGYPPTSLLAAALRRSRAEISMATSDSPTERRDHASREHARACLVRLILSRSPHLNGGTPVPGPRLDLDNTDPAYLCGRLFAEYESAQRAAQGADLNSTITDRTYGKAMTNPMTVYPAIDRLSKAHLRKLRTSEKKGSSASAIAIERRIRELVAALPDLPAVLDIPGQARWMLGYYQQRTANINNAQAATAAGPDAETDPDLNIPEEDNEL